MPEARKSPTRLSQSTGVRRRSAEYTSLWTRCPAVSVVSCRGVVGGAVGGAVFGRGR